MKKENARTRNWAFIVYPESAPENWRGIVDDFHVAWTASPLHDRDVNADGSPKKPHWHVVVMYESVKTADQAQEIADAVRATRVQRVESARAYIRYFAHLDNPEKAQYDKNQIEAHGGVDLIEMLKTSNQTRYDVIKKILEYVVDNDVTEYEDLVIYTMYNEPEWFELLADSGTYFINAFIKSRRHRKERG